MNILMANVLPFSPGAPGIAPRLSDLRQKIGRMERGAGAGIPAVLPLGIDAIDSHLPFRGLALRRLHEVAAAGEREAGAATGFLLSLVIRVMQAEAGPVFWCGRHPELYAPALADYGLDPARLILVRARTEVDRLWAFEEGLRTRGLAVVVAELEKPLDLAGSRRLQLAAEKGATGFALRLDGGDAAASAVETRWRIAAAPSAAPADDSQGIGDPRWQVTLERCRGGRPGHWLMEKKDATGDLSLAPALRDRPDLPAGARVAG
jgi:protein ImuA